MNQQKPNAHLNSIQVADFVEIKSLKSPMPIIQNVFSAVMCLYLNNALEYEWAVINENLADPNFLANLSSLDQNKVSIEVVGFVKKNYILAEYWDPSIIGKNSLVSSQFSKWVTAFILEVEGNK